jgi:hypothetical protein
VPLQIVGDLPASKWNETFHSSQIRLVFCYQTSVKLLTTTSYSTISYYHISYYHLLLSSLNITSYFHILLSSITIISYYSFSLSYLTIINYYHLLLLLSLLSLSLLLLLLLLLNPREEEIEGLRILIKPSSMLLHTSAIRVLPA